MAEPGEKNACGKFGRVLPMLLPPDKDLVSSIKKACNDNGIRSGTIQTAVGSLQKATITHPPSDEAKTGTVFSLPKVIPGPLQILSLVGVIFEKDSGELHVHIHGSFVDQNGKVYGGHLVEGESPVLRRTEAVISEITNVRMIEKFDEVTGHTEFSIERS
jgi:predicted DNA-binding protein with PD1-like motif